MITVTPAAIQRLRQLLLEHPDDRIVRIAIKDRDDHTIAFHITLEKEPAPDDEVQEYEGLIIAIARDSAARMEGVRLDHSDVDGFKFHHPTTVVNGALSLIQILGGPGSQGSGTSHPL